MKPICFLCILALCFSISCSTTRQAKGPYPQEFYTYTPAEQALIRKGKIDIGFDEAQVRMAWGTPSLIKSDSRRKRYTWEYTQLQTRQSVLNRIGDSVVRSTATGTGTRVPVTQNPFEDKLQKRAIFDFETQTVSSFRIFY